MKAEVTRFSTFVSQICRKLTLKAMVRDRRGNQCIECIASLAGCLLSCVEDVIDYVNHYAFARIAIYGMDYCTAARQTMTLFMSRGIDMVINDDLTSTVLLLSCFLSAAVTGLVIGVISKVIFDNDSVETVVLWSFTAFAVSFAMSMSLMVMIKAAISTLFVSFAEGLTAQSAYCDFIHFNEIGFVMYVDRSSSSFVYQTAGIRISHQCLE